MRRLSVVQAEAVDAIRKAGSTSGIVVLPCGTGKTACAMIAAHEHGRKVLFLCFEKQGVMQVADTIRTHSTLGNEFVCVYTSEQKSKPHPLFCYMITTYGMFSSTSSSSSRSDESRKMHKIVTETKWDLVVLDEVHHAAAATYKPFIERLLITSARVLGFTGTLCRTECAELLDENDTRTREQKMESKFEFIGSVLYKRNCSYLEQQGLIAKVKRIVVITDLVPSFRGAYNHALVKGPTKKYVESLHPEKINALWAIVSTHAGKGEIGMVFVNHLLHAKVVRELLGQKWEILAGGHAHGEEGTHTAESNAAMVRRFNAGELSGLIATQVGESALDVFNPNFRYAVVVDAHSGAAAASQKIGRLSRTPRIDRVEGESSDEYRARCVSAQKSAFYYEIVTLGTEEMTAAENRNEQFEFEGYKEKSITYACLMDSYATYRAGLPANGLPGSALPCISERAHTKLLVEALSYTAKGTAAVSGGAQAQEFKKMHKMRVSNAKLKSQKTPSKIFKQRHKRHAKVLQSKNKLVHAEAMDISRAVVAKAQLDMSIITVLRDLRLDKSVLKDLCIHIPKLTAPKTDTDDSSNDSSN